MGDNTIERVARAISASFREEGAYWDGKWDSEAEQIEFHKAAKTALNAIPAPVCRSCMLVPDYWECGICHEYQGSIAQLNDKAPLSENNNIA